jgi:hypothetical protein
LQRLDVYDDIGKFWQSDTNVAEELGLGVLDGIGQGCYFRSNHDRGEGRL